MAKEIKQRIVLEGEKEYNRAIAEAQRNLKTLKSELKAETAELGKNASEQQKNEAKTKSLKAQIAEQEKIVKTLREALEQAKKEYGDNADVVQKWEQKLNGARTTLANMKSDLDGVGTGFGNVNANAAQATVATKSVADALGSIGDASGNISDSIESIFSGLIDKIRETVEALWGLITETAAKANNWTDLAALYGSSAQEVQMWDRAIQAAGGSFEKFQSAITRLAYGGKEKSITSLLGVSKENYQDDLQYTLAVFDAIEKKKEELGAGGQNALDDILSEVFGARKSADVMWFINNAHGHTGQNGEWVNGWRDNPEQWNADEGGFGMTSEELATMNDVWIKTREIDEKWKAIKEKFAAGFGVATFDLLVNVSGVLDGIAEYMSATTDGEKAAALDKIRTNIEDFFRKIGEIIQESIHIIRDVGLELKESDDPLTSAIGDILLKLAEGLQWMVDNQEAVKGAFEAIFGVWLIAKLAAVAGKLSGILMQIETIKAFKGINLASNAAASGAGAAAGEAVSSTAGGAAASTAGTAAGGGLAGLIKTGLATAAPWLSVAAISGGLWFGLGELARNRDWGEFEANEEKNAARTDLPEIMSEIAKAAVGTDEFDEDYDWEQLFRENAEALQKLTPDSDLWGKIGEWADTSDGLQQTEIDDILANMLNYGIFSEDFNEMFKDAYNRLSEMDQSEIPEDWWRTTGSWNGGENGVTSGDLQDFRSVPANVEKAAENGVAKGVRGLKVEIDGYAAGRILAPYVSAEIAKSIE